METHAQDLHKAPGHGWKHYFFEFFMLFLAVFCGFLAENFREHISDKQKENEYIKSLVNNLAEDTLHLKETILENQWKAKGLDSLLRLSNKNMAEPQTKKGIYHYASRYSSFYSAFFSNDATMMQLKNSGAMRYIKKEHVADSIAKYDQEMRAIYAAETPYSQAINNAEETKEEILVYSVYDDTTLFKYGEFSDKELPLLITDPQKIQVFFNKISAESGWTKNYVRNLEARLPFAERLIAFLKKEYKME